MDRHQIIRVTKVTIIRWQAYLQGTQADWYVILDSM
jgi:hypothetical protein